MNQTPYFPQFSRRNMACNPCAATNTMIKILAVEFNYSCILYTSNSVQFLILFPWCQLTPILICTAEQTPLQPETHENCRICHIGMFSFSSDRCGGIRHQYLALGYDVPFIIFHVMVLMECRYGVIHMRESLLKTCEKTLCSLK